MDFTKSFKYPLISNLYDGKSVFITGSTGFVGKLIVEKLLRCCYGIVNIYLLVRPKNNKNIKDRLHELTMSPAFDLVREKDSKTLKKLILIEGDISSLELGISKSDQLVLLENVSIVINSAASVHFGMPIKKAVFTNLRSIRELINLARQMRKLESFIHTSTAFCNIDVPHVNEEFYKTDYDYDAVISLCENFPDHILEKITPELIKKYPNSYLFVKHLAESLISKEAVDLPLAIVRPSIIGPCLLEPKVGWIDAYAAITTILDSISRGIVCCGFLNKNIIADVIPADMVVNTIIAASWRVANESSGQKLKIFHSTAGDVSPFTFYQFGIMSRDIGLKTPSENIVWYPQIRIYRSKWMFDLDQMLNHIFPAYLMDLYAKITGQKAKSVKIAKLFKKNYEAASFATLIPFNFKSDETKKLFTLMSLTEREIYNFDLKTINWQNYFQNYHSGIRKYILKETSNEKLGKKKLSKLKAIKYITTAFIFMTMLSIIGKFAQLLFCNWN